MHKFGPRAGIEVLILLIIVTNKPRFNACIYQESPKKGKDNIDRYQLSKQVHFGQVSEFDKANTRENKESPQHQGANNTPEKNLVVVFSRNLEKTKYQDEHKEIVYRKGLLDPVGRLKLGEFFFSGIKVNEDTKKHGNANPDDRPDGGLLISDHMAVFIEDSEVYQ